MQSEINELFGQLDGQLEEESKGYEEKVKKQAERLIRIKEENVSKVRKKIVDQQGKTVDVVRDEDGDDRRKKSKDDVVSLEDWKIDYDEK